MIFTEIIDGSEFVLEFVNSRNLRIGPYGKHWPLTTQCILSQNSRVLAVGEVVKHEQDKDNPKYARMYSAKKAFAQRPLWKDVRKRFWAKILAD